MVSFHIAVPHASPPLAASAVAAAWTDTARIPLTWDVAGRREASEPTIVHVATDGRTLFVRFDATQREPVVATARSNDVGKGSDDAVWVDLWPNGANGFWYQFEVTPNGTHYESSSENSGYQPTWSSSGALDAHGYTATLGIPLAVLRGARAGTWRAQFVRYVHATGEEQVWSYDAQQLAPDDAARAGKLTMPIIAAGAARRPQPRVELYALGIEAPRSAGGSTARTGADISVPVAPSTSFYATLHPDFSNVELDQQTIAPSVYQRFFSEARPFFTQGSSLYNKMSYWVTNAPIAPLYTPAIPTPSDGYAIEGKARQFSFGGFDALGVRRSDSASVIDYASPDTKLQGSIQRVMVATPELLDTVSTASFTYNSLVHDKFYVSYGHDAGTNITDPRHAQWYDAGAAWVSKTFALYGAMRKVGVDYDPVDGYVFHPDIAGYGVYAVKIFDFSHASKLASLGTQLQFDRYQGHTLGSSESDNQVMLDLLTKSAWDVQLFSGSNYWRFDQVLTPVSQSGGFSLTYHSGLQTDNPSQFPTHGNSATPTTLAYNTGRYGDGRLDTWFRSSTIRVGSRATLTLTADDTAQRFANAPSNVQWFDSAGFTDQIGANSSLAIGLRRVTGLPPLPNGGGNCSAVCTNVSLAYHYRLKRSEIYLAYGNPNTLTTTPQVIFKTIFYAGADKGS